MTPLLPWNSLPPTLAGCLRPRLAEVVAEIIEAVARDVPEYARPIEGAFGEGLQLGVEVALGRFLDLPGTSRPALGAEGRRLYLRLGSIELRQGRELASLFAAYRAGARVAFRRFAALARAAGFDADVLVLLAESVFAYIDELSAVSAEGYAREQSLRAGETDRRRGELLALLLSGVADGPALTSAAGQARWPLPDELVPVVVRPDAGDGLAEDLGGAALVGPAGGAVVALLATPGDRAAFSGRIAGRGAVVGPPCPPAGLPASLALARFAGTLASAGLLPGDPVHVEDHLTTLLLHRDPDLVRLLAARRLAPLAAVKETTRERLAETLLAWLRHRGERQHVAAALHVHPQTVGYRLGQLRELFGDDLDDPQARFELEVTLRALAAVPPDRGKTV